jgi:hypothetical protein
LAEQPLPWLYPYREDAQSTRGPRSRRSRGAGRPCGRRPQRRGALGSVGFLDRFTVTASRFAQAVAVEERDVFDERFGIVNTS